MFRLALILGLLVPLGALAAVPQYIEQVSLSDITPIENPETRQVFYGQLASFPHTYEIVATKPFTLSVAVRVPDIDEAENIVSSIVIKEKEIRGVEEVMRLSAKDADWQQVYESFEGETYREGGIYGADVDAGVYRVEVHTPTNVEKYALVIGAEEVAVNLGYFEKVRHVIAVKKFFGKPAIAALATRTVYLPVVVLLAIVGALYYWRKKKRSADVV